MTCIGYDNACYCPACTHTESIVILNNYPSYLSSPRFRAKMAKVSPPPLTGIAGWMPAHAMPPPPIPSAANVSGSGKFIPTKNGGWFWKPDDEPAKEPPATTRTKLDPQTCLTCKTVNEYAGPEHLQANGTYICRSCRSH